ncbi:hypothetical protein RRG08_026356 [Elysia crispata]|uniref:Uncharacterized protein n=1 Tax=Elysia crispata TaxID=231223 RepID=A0AAE1CJ11_9GAST|nr:hypothetical protein RRG08_026356 [Elysia crispata]
MRNASPWAASGNRNKECDWLESPNHKWIMPGLEPEPRNRVQPDIYSVRGTSTKCVRLQFRPPEKNIFRVQNAMERRPVG